MKITGSWYSPDGLKLDIDYCSKNTLQGTIQSDGNIQFKRKKFKGIILKQDEQEAIFSFYLKLNVLTENEFDYLLTLGSIKEEKNQMNLVLAKFHFTDNHRSPISIKRFILIFHLA
jgi:hypothetical protein